MGNAIEGPGISWVSHITTIRVELEKALLRSCSETELRIEATTNDAIPYGP